VVQSWAVRFPERIRHLRRQKGGQGKAHTLNHGITQILREPWAEALLIIDADVLLEDSALRQMTRHLSRPDVGAVTAYVKEGTPNGNYLTRFIAFEYVTAQAAGRRAQNVFGALACLAGGAQLHSRESLCRIGGRIDTSSLAEDTATAFQTQLSGKRVVFEGNAVVWAEEPSDLVGLWKQRLRWARGNVQISLQFSFMWLHGRRYGGLSRGVFAFIWFTVLLMPILMMVVSPGLLSLYFIDAAQAWAVFRTLWILHAVAYVFATAMSFAIDPSTARRAWRQGILFPGVISLGIIVYSVAPGALGAVLTGGLEDVGVAVTPRLVRAAQLFVYGWLAGSMLVAYAAKWIAERWRHAFPSNALIYLAGYGAFLCAVTFAAYIRELRGARLTWDKTIKTGKVVMAP
jgi:cellulose synthase/poly-beta-1,6-N-acetylglucosamine synthase-like glycosyltransferase